MFCVSSGPRAAPLLMVVDPQTSPAERVGERMFFVEEVVERVERIRVPRLGRAFLDGQVGREQPVRQALRSGRDLVTLIANQSLHFALASLASGFIGPV